FCNALMAIWEDSTAFFRLATSPSLVNSSAFNFLTVACTIGRMCSPLSTNSPASLQFFISPRYSSFGTQPISFACSTILSLAPSSTPSFSTVSFINLTPQYLQKCPGHLQTDTVLYPSHLYPYNRHS